MMRWWRHAISELLVNYYFPPHVLDKVQREIAANEAHHFGEIALVIEGALRFVDLYKGTSPRSRAHAMFSQLRVWDTENNNGVLIYVLLADRAIEIVADRSIATRVQQHEWQAICSAMQMHFAIGEFETGVIAGVVAAQDLLMRYFPMTELKQTNEIPDRPQVL